MERERRLDAVLIAVGSPHPIATRIARFAGIPPLGIAYLGAVLRGGGMGVRLVDLNVPGWTRERLARLIFLQRPHVAGISCTTESYRNAIRLGTWLKRLDPSLTIVAGGPHVTFEDAAALRTGAFDVIVRGEGEETVEALFPRLISGAGPDRSIDGISFVDPNGAGDGIVRADARRQIQDLDLLPHPARDLLPLERYGSPGAILTGRGCPGRCLFCSASAMSGGRYRVRNEEAVFAEIRSLSAVGLREIVFLDDTLTGDRARLERLLSVLERGRAGIVWSCESRIEAVDAALLRRMARCGCHSIQYGIESGSRGSQQRVGKGLAEGGAESIIRATHRAGIVPVCSFIIGLPWEDAEEVRGTIAFALGLQRRYLARIGFGILVCYPGTPFWRHGNRYGLRRRTRDFDAYTMYIPTCATARLSTDDQRSLHFEAVLRQIREAPRELLEMSPGMHEWIERARDRPNGGEG